MTIITLGVAFVAGLISFLSPCVLPIIPGFLAYLAGASVDGSNPRRLEVFLNSLFFVLGFGVVFAALGVLLNTVLAAVAGSVQLWLSRAGGILIILFGLYLTGLINIPGLDRTYSFKIKRKFNSRYLTSFLFGLAFAAGWTPCVGPALGSILGLAASQPASAFTLLLSYALGLGLPFLVVGLFAAQAAVWINKYAGKLRILNIIFGILLVILGILIFTESLSLVANVGFLNNFVLTH
jgi:cytochrome c-type biogenesis protein